MIIWSAGMMKLVDFFKDPLASRRDRSSPGAERDAYAEPERPPDAEVENWYVMGWYKEVPPLDSYWKWPFIVDFPIKNGDFP